MRLPERFLDDLRDRTSLVRVAGRKVSWDMRKSNQGKGDYWAPCPFHQEKTASFHVDDRKGVYYCFGCQASGNAIKFVCETENVGFMEAVEILAREAGMEVPKPTPEEKEKDDREGALFEVMERAVRHYRERMKGAAAAEARDYLAGRGLGRDALDRWEIGFAPDEWTGLRDALEGAGVAKEQLLAAGLAKPGRDGGRPYDTFRGRIMFPIRDARKRCVAFGGRAMDPDDSAKYLNSPETELFSKRRALFNVGPARAAAGKDVPLVVAEGYMDVIALSEAGFEAAVAPLGTAVTEEQLRMLWRVSPEPIVALDGDAAGFRAAARLADVALPMLGEDRSLRFAIMPAGQDPDDVIRAGGAGAMQELLDRAEPMIRLLWRRETEGKVFDSPERKAALDKALRAAIDRIPDPQVRYRYNEEARRLSWEQFGPAKGQGKGQGGAAARAGAGQWRGHLAQPGGPTRETRLSALAKPAEDGTIRFRESVILAVLVAHPGLAEEFAVDLEGMHCADGALERVRRALLEAGDGASAADLAGPGALEKLMGEKHIRVIPAIRRPGDAGQARQVVAEELRKLEAERGATREIDEAMQDIADEGAADENITWRLGQAAEALREAAQGEAEDPVEYDAAPSGARINRGEREAFAALLKEIEAAPPRRGARR